MFASSDQESVSGFNLAAYLLVLSALIFVDFRTDLLKPGRAFLSYVTYPVSVIAALPDRMFNHVDDFLENEPNVEYAYQHLHSEYVKLKAQMLQMQVIENENQRLRGFFGIVNSADLDMQLAKPLKIDLDPYQHRVLINKGIKDGVYIGQAVLDDTGVVGQVTDMFKVSSVVTLITDPSHAIPVQVRRNGLHLLVEGTGSFNLLRVPYLNKNMDIQEGDILETSGLGGRFPSGYPVAAIKAIENDIDETFLHIKANPIAAIDSLRYVLLVDAESEKVRSQ